MIRRLATYVGRHFIALLALFVALGGTSYAVAKLPRNSVGTKQLKKNAVISTKVKDRSLLARDFKNGQLPVGPTGPQGPAGSPGAQGPQGPKGEPTYLATIVVGPVGTPVQNGAALRSAYAAVPSDGRPFLVKVEPGTYQLGTEPLAMKSYVDLEGSGAADTSIEGTSDSASTGVIVMATLSDLRHLSVTDVGRPGKAANAVYAKETVFTTIDHVSTFTVGGTDNVGVKLEGSSPTILDSSLVGFGGSNAYGIFGTASGATKSSPVIERTYAAGTNATNSGGGLNSDSGVNTIRWSDFVGDDAGVILRGGNSSNKALIGASQLEGTEAVHKSLSETAICAASLDEAFVPVTSACVRVP